MLLRKRRDQSTSTQSHTDESGSQAEPKEGGVGLGFKEGATPVVRGTEWGERVTGDVLRREYGNSPGRRGEESV